MLTDAELVELHASRVAARVKRKEINRRRYTRRFARIKAQREKGRG